MHSKNTEIVQIKWDHLFCKTVNFFLLIIYAEKCPNQAFPGYCMTGVIKDLISPTCIVRSLKTDHWTHSLAVMFSWYCHNGESRKNTGAWSVKCRESSRCSVESWRANHVHLLTMGGHFRNNSLMSLICNDESKTNCYKNGITVRWFVKKNILATLKMRKFS